MAAAIVPRALIERLKGIQRFFGDSQKIPPKVGFLQSLSYP